MTTERHHIEVGGLRVEIVRKDIKNLHIGVHPPHGRVRVAAPMRLSDEAVRLAIVSRLGWIRRQQAEFAGQERQSQREMVSGESHFYLGRRYRLTVIEKEGPPGVRLRNNTKLELLVRPGTETAGREAVLQRWYRQRLRQQLFPLVGKWQSRTGVGDVEVRIRRMKTRWGTCTIDARRIWLNLELIKKPVSCLEYILVHEMIHLIERHHNERFRQLMDEIIPLWRNYREELNRAPLAHEDWEY